jgi:hypothetical protein
MFDIDKWGPLQWLLGIGLAFGGFISAWMGSRSSRNAPIEDTASRERARIEERERFELQAKVTEERIRRDFEAAISAARKSFYDEFRRLDDETAHKFEQLEERLRKAEMEVEVQKSRRQPPR